jgi:ATP synthase I chain
VTDGKHPDHPASASPEGSAEESPAELAPEDWQNSKELGSAEISAQEMGAYGSTVRRVERMIVAVGIVCAVAAAGPLGWALTGGMLLGTLLAWINFRWLASSVNAIGERIVKIKSRERGAAIVGRGVGRIFLIAVFAYVIFTCSVRGLVGFLAGLAIPVLAMMCEAVYEFVATSRRPS